MSKMVFTEGQGPIPRQLSTLQLDVRALVLKATRVAGAASGGRTLVRVTLLVGRQLWDAWLEPGQTTVLARAEGRAYP